MTRRNQSVTLSISDADKAELEAIALQFGITWGDRPNISKLVEAIAQRKLTVNWAENTPPEKLRATQRKQSREAIAKIKEGLDQLLIALE